MPWVSQGHGLPYSICGVPVGYATTVWQARGPVDPAVGRAYGWKSPKLTCMFARDMFDGMPGARLADPRTV
jgi:hypothetical protein